MKRLGVWLLRRVKPRSVVECLFCERHHSAGYRCPEMREDAKGGRGNMGIFMNVYAHVLKNGRS